MFDKCDLIAAEILADKFAGTLLWRLFSIVYL